MFNRSNRTSRPATPLPPNPRDNRKPAAPPRLAAAGPAAAPTGAHLAASPPAASNNPQFSSVQAARRYDVVRNRMTGKAASPGPQVRSHIEDDIDAQEAVRARDYERQLVEWESAAPEAEVDGRRQAAERIRQHIESKQTYLNLSCLGLTSLPELPQGLTELDAGSNQLTSLPELPQALTHLSVYGNRLTSLPELPQCLKMLSAHSNQLTSLPKLPQGLIELIVFKNQLTSLPKLPESLIWINASNNRLASLPKLPQGRLSLWLHGNLQINIPAELIVGTHYGCANTVRQWQSDHPDLVDQSAAAPATAAELPAATLAEHHPDHAATITLPVQQPSVTFDEHRRIAELLVANTTPRPPTFTPELHATLTALATIEQDIFDVVTRQPLVMQGATPSPEEMDKLIQFVQIKFADDSKKQQWEAEIGALKTDYPSTADGGLKLYNLLFKTLIALSNNAARDVSGIAGTSHGMVSPFATRLKIMAGLLRLVPGGGDQMAAVAQAVVGSADHRRMSNNLVNGLDAMETIDNALTPLQRDAAMHRMLHALSYRLALDHCEKKNPPRVTPGLFNNAVGTSGVPIDTFKTYAKKITVAIMQPARTFNDNDPDLAVARLLTAALTGSSLRGLKPVQAEARANVLGEKHQQIIDKIMTRAGSGAIPAATSTGIAPQSGNLTGTSNPTPNAGGQNGVQVLTAQIAQIAQQFAALQNEQLELKAQQEEDKRTVQALQSENQTLKARLAQNDQRLEQNDQRFATMESENHTLRAELQTLTNKPVDPMIDVLHRAVDGLNAQLASLQTNLNLTHSSTASAHVELQTLTTQLHSLHGAQASLKEDVNTLQVSLDDTPEKAAVAELGDQVAGLVQDKHRADADLRMLKKSVSKLEVDSDSGTGSGGLALMARTDSAFGRSVADQHVQFVALQDHINLLSQTISELREQLGIVSMVPVTEPDEVNKRRLFGNLPE
jgi:hypothetical protein